MDKFRMPNDMKYFASIAFLSFFYEKGLITDAEYDRIVNDLQEVLGIDATIKQFDQH